MAANEKYLTKSDGIFYVTSGVTTYAEIKAAWDAGWQVILVRDNREWYYASWDEQRSVFMFSGLKYPTGEKYFYCYSVDSSNGWYESNIGKFITIPDVLSTNLPYSSTSYIPCASAVTKYIVENAVPRSVSISVSGYSAVTQTTAPTATTLYFNNEFIYSTAYSTYKYFKLRLSDFYRCYLQSIGSYNVNNTSSASTTGMVQTLRYYLPNIKVGRYSGTSQKVVTPTYFSLNSTSVVQAQTTSATTSDGVRIAYTEVHIYIS